MVSETRLPEVDMVHQTWTEGVVVELRAKNQITIPATLARAAGLEPGDRLVLELREGEIRLRRLRHSYAGTLAGVYGSPEEVQAYLLGEREAWGD
ncbi:MAG TPA: AbrB/MazE/SpoVT family DNA-binding domain-containing protein [Chloroflexota bacterium]|nr:AbrB/MazE/SpoVT family DNA-binding domain-containing protein [Chloroflexota bacterium]